MNQFDLDLDDNVLVKHRHPQMWNVLYFNDHVTTADFVIKSLTMVFGKSTHDAVILTKEVDTKGQCIAGCYTKDIASTKREEVLAMAKREHFPFKVEIEPVDDEEDE